MTFFQTNALGRALTLSGVFLSSLSAYAQSITSFAPASAVPGASVTITGTGFNSTAANNVVFFGATRATVAAATSNSLTVTVPSGASYAPITALNTGTSLVAYSPLKFNPVFSPAKSGFTASDFLPKVDFSAGAYPSSIAVGDLDGDGKPEIVSESNGDNFISYFRNISTTGTINSGSFAPRVDIATGSGSNTNSIIVADLDLYLAPSSFVSVKLSFWAALPPSGGVARLSPRFFLNHKTWRCEV